MAFVTMGTLSLMLSSCLTLSQDVTPPPGDPASPTQLAAETAEEAGDGLIDAAETAAPGVVMVEVIDQTGGALLQKNLTVRLEAYDQFELVFESSLDLPPTAQVRFSEVPFQADRVFFASVAYGGAIYRSEIVQAAQETTSFDLQVQIFDTTTDRTNLVIDRLHILIDFPAPEVLQVSEIFVLSNLGSDTVVAMSPGLASVEFSLPEGAGSLFFEDGTLGGRYILTEDGFGDSVSIPPGQGVYQVVVSYILPYDRNRLNFVQRVNYPLSSHVLLVPSGSAKVKNSSLRDVGVQTISSGEIQVFSGGEILSGGELKFKLTGSPYGTQGFSFLSIELSASFLIGLGVLGVGLLVSGIWLYFKTRKKELDIDRMIFSPDARDDILDSIIALEDHFQAGEVGEDDYRKKRQQLKEQLRKITENE